MSIISVLFCSHHGHDMASKVLTANVDTRLFLPRRKWGTGEKETWVPTSTAVSSSFKAKIWNLLTWLSQFLSLRLALALALFGSFETAFFTSSATLPRPRTSFRPQFFMISSTDVGTQSILNFSQLLAALPETKCFSHTRSFSKTPLRWGCHSLLSRCNTFFHPQKVFVALRLDLKTQKAPL